MKKALYIIIPLLIAFTLRLYPTLISGMPFSTDAWPLIRNTELLLQNTPIPLNSNIFDGYNNFWPASQLFGAILSQITTLPPITAMALGIPIAAALTIPIFYLLVKKITQNNTTSLIASILLAAAFPFTFYAAGVTKEAFASPIYISLILIFILKHNWKTTLLFCVASVALVLTHHLTAFFAVGIISSLSIASFISKKSKDEKGNSNQSNILFNAILISITTIYFLLFASPGFMLTITLNILLSVGAYLIFVIALALGLVYFTRKFSRKRAFFYWAIGSLLSIEFMFMTINICTLPGVHWLYALPMIIGLPIVIFALYELYQKNPVLIVPLFWLVPVIAFTGFTVFANPPDASALAWRSMNFILPPLIILIAIGVHKLYIASKHIKIQRIAKCITILIILSIVTINTYGLYATVSEQSPYLGYFWLYYPSEYKASNWIAININNQTVAGDAKVDYLLHQYFNETVSTTTGLRFLEGNGSEPEILYIYNQMYGNGKGYVLGGIPIILPANWTDKLADYNVVYANSEVTIYARRKLHRRTS